MKHLVMIFALIFSHTAFSHEMKRLKPRQWLSLMAECSKIDASAKGANEHDAWQLLETSCSTLCGYSTTI